MMTYEEQETQDGAAPSTDYPESEAFKLLCARLAEAKAAESAAQAARIEIEKAVLAFLPTKPEGSVTRSLGAWKVTATYPVNRSIDAAALDSVRTELPMDLFDQAIDYKPVLNLSGLRVLQSAHPEAYALLAQAITAKPGKPGVKIEHKEP